VASAEKRLASEASVSLPQRVLITGAAGFVGSSIALELAKRYPDAEVVGFDNLRRRGSELNLPRLAEAGVEFVHGDVRHLSDLEQVGELGALVECSAEPSALAGISGDEDYALHSNLLGAYHCLQLARSRGAQVVFISTSRVYPYDRLNGLHFRENETRWELAEDQPERGASAAGVAEEFPLEGPRTLYGATKLAAELLVAEYAAAFGLRTVVNRCGVIAGPWQMGKVDQGVFTYWMLGHYFRRELKYIGFGGSGKQVRDLVHVDDVVELVIDQLNRPEEWAGATVNVGGGAEFSLSLVETTELCRELTGNRLPIPATAETRPGDVCVYLSDCSRLYGRSSWRPRNDPAKVLEDIFHWISENERAVESALR
jgi:CDP-paratose 2-epimerase